MESDREGNRDHILKILAKSTVGEPEKVTTVLVHGQEFGS